MTTPDSAAPALNTVDSLKVTGFCIPRRQSTRIFSASGFEKSRERVEAAAKDEHVKRIVQPVPFGSNPKEDTHHVYYEFIPSPTPESTTPDNAYLVARAICRRVDKVTVSEAIARHILLTTAVQNADQPIVEVINLAGIQINERLKQLEVIPEAQDVTELYRNAAAYCLGLITHPSESIIEQQLLYHQQCIAEHNARALQERLNDNPPTESGLQVVVLPPNEAVRISVPRSLEANRIVIQEGAKLQDQITNRMVQAVEESAAPMPHTPSKAEAELPTDTAKVPPPEPIAIHPAPIAKEIKAPVVKEVPGYETPQMVEKGNGFADLQIELGGHVVNIVGASLIKDLPPDARNEYMNLLQEEFARNNVQALAKEGKITEALQVVLFHVAGVQRDKNLQPLSLSLYVNAGENDVLATFGVDGHIQQVNTRKRKVTEEKIPPKPHLDGQFNVITRKSQPHIAYVLSAAPRNNDTRKMWTAINNGLLSKMASPNTSYARKFFPAELAPEQVESLFAEILSKAGAFAARGLAVNEIPNDSGERDTAFMEHLKALISQLEDFKTIPILGKFIKPFLIQVREISELANKADNTYIGLLEKIPLEKLGDIIAKLQQLGDAPGRTAVRCKELAQVLQTFFEYVDKVQNPTEEVESVAAENIEVFAPGAERKREFREVLSLDKGRGAFECIVRQKREEIYIIGTPTHPTDPDIGFKHEERLKKIIAELSSQEIAGDPARAVQKILYEFEKTLPEGMTVNLAFVLSLQNGRTYVAKSSNTAGIVLVRDIADEPLEQLARAHTEALGSKSVENVHWYIEDITERLESQYAEMLVLNASRIAADFGPGHDKETMWGIVNQLRVDNLNIVKDPQKPTEPEAVATLVIRRTPVEVPGVQGPVVLKRTRSPLTA